MEAKIEGVVTVNATFECRDADGNVVKVIELTGTVPLEAEDGPDDSA